MPASLRLLFLSSLFGTAACTAAHVLTFADIAFYPILIFVPLLFIVWPLVLWQLRHIPRKNIFSEIFGTIPHGLKLGAALLLAYVFINFFLCLRLNEGGEPVRLTENKLVLKTPEKIIREITPEAFRHAQAIQVRLLTGHLLVFFALAACATHICWLKTGPAMAKARIYPSDNG
jgi:hypothetical protein